ncbi:MAG: DNA polymerase III subunit delta [Magnetospirillum sp. WYHS-4]
MKIQGGDVESFLRQPPVNLAAILVYGPDSGLVKERLDALARSVVGNLQDPFRLVELDAAGLKRDPARLSDEARALSFGGGKRVVRIRQAGDAAGPILEEFLASAPGGAAMVLVEGGDLASRSPLRKVFEQAKNGAAVACYADDARSLPGVIRETLQARGLTLAPDALAFLAENLGSDRLVTRQELEKLALYCGKGMVTLEDARACVGDSAASSLDALVGAAAGGKPDELDLALQRALAEGVAAVGILRAAGRHFHRLHLVRGLVDRGMAPDAAVQKLRPPLFFKTADAFRAQLRLWTGIGLARALEILTEAEIDCKTTGMPDDAVCARALMRLAQAAGAGERRRA